MISIVFRNVVCFQKELERVSNNSMSASETLWFLVGSLLFRTSIPVCWRHVTLTQQIFFGLRRIWWIWKMMLCNMLHYWNSSFIFFRKTLNCRLWQTAGKKGMENMWTSCDGLPSSPKSKRRAKAFGDSTKTHYHHFFRTLGGIYTKCVPSYGWWGGQLCSSSVRMLPARSRLSLINRTLSPRSTVHCTLLEDQLVRDLMWEGWG